MAQQILTYGDEGAVELAASANTVVSADANGNAVANSPKGNLAVVAGVLTGSRFINGVAVKGASFTAVGGTLYKVTAASTATLPLSNTLPAGTEIRIKNTSGGTVTMGGADTVNGGASGSTTVATTVEKSFITDGVSDWTTTA